MNQTKSPTIFFSSSSYCHFKSVVFFLIFFFLSLNYSSATQKKKMSRVYIEFAVGDKQDRLDIQLFDNRCPNAVANFLYLLTAHEIPEDVISAREKAIGGGCSLPAPLKASRFTRIDVGKKQIDFGVSGTSSVFGGCYDDEAVGPTEQEQAQLSRDKKAVHPNFLHQLGTLSVANCGPNTNGSNFFISLGRRPEVDGLHQIIGILAPHSQQALKNLASCKVNLKKGCVPEPAVRVHDCGIIRALNDNWKEVALGTNLDAMKANPHNQQIPQTTTTSSLSRLKQLRGRGSQLEKRLAQGDGESLMNFEEDQQRQQGDGSSKFADMQANAEAGELARRRAKRRRIEDAAAGAGAWVEPPEVSSGTATKSGVVDSRNKEIKFGSDISNYNNKFSKSGGSTTTMMSISQAYQAAGGNLNEATEIVSGQQQQQLSARNMFAVAARTNQFMQNVDSLTAQYKAKAHKKQNNAKKRNLRY